MKKLSIIAVFIAVLLAAKLTMAQVGRPIYYPPVGQGGSGGSTNGFVGPTITNGLAGTNIFNVGFRPVTRPTYDGVETTVILIDGNSGSDFAVDITKNTTLRFTNMWNGALTNAIRPNVNVSIRQDSVGTWTVGTQLTNCLIAYGVGGTNLGVRSNANTISWGSFAGSMVTNSQMQGSVVTNSVP